MNKKRILIVDDDPAILKTLVEYFTTLGYKTASAQNGHDGHFAYTRYKPDLIITDYQMPCMNGEEMAGIIRGEDLTTPIFLHTGLPALAKDKSLFTKILLKPDLDELVKEAQKELGA